MQKLFLLKFLAERALKGPFGWPQWGMDWQSSPGATVPQSPKRNAIQVQVPQDKKKSGFFSLQIQSFQTMKTMKDILSSMKIFRTKRNLMDRTARSFWFRHSADTHNTVYKEQRYILSKHLQGSVPYKVLRKHSYLSRQSFCQMFLENDNAGN